MSAYEDGPIRVGDTFEHEGLRYTVEDVDPATGQVEVFVCEVAGRGAVRKTVWWHECLRAAAVGGLAYQLGHHGPVNPEAMRRRKR